MCLSNGSLVLLPQNRKTLMFLFWMCVVLVIYNNKITNVKSDTSNICANIFVFNRIIIICKTQRVSVRYDTVPDVTLQVGVIFEKFLPRAIISRLIMLSQHASIDTWVENMEFEVVSTPSSKPLYERNTYTNRGRVDLFHETKPVAKWIPSRCIRFFDRYKGPWKQYLQCI